MTSVRKDILVNASQERCFRVFTAGMDKWWPREHHIGSSPLKEMLVEPHVGGRWYSVSEDGSEADVGKVKVWSPSERLVLTWQLTAKWTFDPAFVTDVEVRFVPVGPNHTRVELEHKNLDAYGADAAAMKETFEKDDAWVRTLALFGGIAEASAPEATAAAPA